MTLQQWYIETNWTLRRKWFGVWEIKDFYTNLEQRAKAGAEITFGYVLMVLASACLATGGLLLNNPAVVIGSMCVAPFLGPSRAVCIGGLFRNRKVFWGGLLKQLFGLLIIGAGTSYIITAVLRISVTGMGITTEILLRAMPTLRHVVISMMIAVSAGVAAALALSADPHIVQLPWGQVIDAVIGVEIAISLIPPAAVVGIGLAFGRMDISRNAFLLLMVNVLGLDIFGSMLMLLLRGIRGRHLTTEKSIRQAVESKLDSIPEINPVNSIINVSLLSDTIARVYVSLRNQSVTPIPASLAQMIAMYIRDKTHCRTEVAVEVIPCQIYSSLEEE